MGQNNWDMMGSKGWYNRITMDNFYNQPNDVPVRLKMWVYDIMVYTDV